MTAVRLLGPQDRTLVDAVLAKDPVVHGFVVSRVEAGLLASGAMGELWGFPSAAPTSLLHVGANLVPVNADESACAAFARHMGQFRPFLSIVGRSEEVALLWPRLCEESDWMFARPRAVRERQPFLAMGRPSPLAADPRVERITLQHFDSYLAASVAMYTEELEQDPMRDNAEGYRRYIRTLMTGGRTYGILQDDRVVFKADISAVTRHTAQVQGVWVHPSLRGRGLAAPAMAAVTNRIVASGRTASLYVNDFNAPALATYRRCGYEQLAVFTTVLY